MLFTSVAFHIAWRDDRVSLRATCVILALIVVFESRVVSVHGTVSPLRNRFLSVIGSRTVGFRRRRYGWFFSDSWASCFYARQQLLLSVRLYVRLFVRLSHGWISQKWCMLRSPNLHRRLRGRLYSVVSGSVKLFHKFERCYPDRGR